MLKDLISMRGYIYGYMEQFLKFIYTIYLREIQVNSSIINLNNPL